MKLSLPYPVYPHVKTQGFGESYACINPTTRQVVGKPLGGVCPVGTVDLYTYSGMRGHQGTDIYAPDATPIHASLEGVVEEICTEEARGLGIGIVSENKYETIEGETLIKTRYWHLKAILVSKGQKVKAGDLIGLVDNTGYSSGNHLHMEAKAVVWNGGVLSNINQGNGYYGAFNFEPYFNGQYAKDIRVKPFTQVLKYGMVNNSEVRRMQELLKKKGYFTYPECTGNYFGETMKAVYLFQQENISMSWYERYILRGSLVGEKTNAALSKVI